MRGAPRGWIDADLQRRQTRALPAGRLRRAGALAIALCAAGCFSDRGVAIEVDVGDTGATSVELYLGERGCSPGDNQAGINCESIAPPPPNGTDAPIALAGDVFFRDDPEPDGQARYIAEVKGGKATFVITADTARTLPIVIAVGIPSDDQGVRGLATLRGLDVPANSGRIVRTTLVLTKPVVPGEINPVDEDRVQVWEKMEPANSCVVVEHWRAGVVEREFVVPEGDPDCDDVATECNAAAYRGSSAGGMASVPSCFVPEGFGCVLGSRACSDDGAPTSDACIAQQEATICAPSQFCVCTGLDPACVQNVIDTVSLPHITCTIPTTAEGNPCSNKNSGTINLDAPSMDLGVSCDQPRLGSLELAALSTNTNSFSFGGAVMALESPGAPCHFSIVWKSGTHMRSLARVEYGVVQLQTGDRITLVPITFDFTDDFGQDTCGTDQMFECTSPISPTDPLATCAQGL